MYRYKFFTGLREDRLYALDNFTHWVSVPKTRQAPSLLGLRGPQFRSRTEEIEKLVVNHQHSVLPQGGLGKALHYTGAQWTKLTEYVKDGRWRWPIDNNPCENPIRPFVVGRRNWLFADTPPGAQASANLYSLLQTCRANGVNTYEYLKALFVALPLAKTADDYEALLPWRIKLPT